MSGNGPAELAATDRFPRLERGDGHTSLLEAAGALRDGLLASGRPSGVATGDLVTYPYPTSFGLWRAARSPAPMLWLTARMLVVQWDEPVRRRRRGPDGQLGPSTRRRTLLWGAGDHERAVSTPFAVRLRARLALPDRLVLTTRGTVLGHLRALGIDPLDVDYVAFDTLQVRDVRRLLGTTRPAPDLDAPDAPLRGWFPNASLVVSVAEWAALHALHPIQAAWYEPATFAALDPDRITPVSGDVLLGPGVALLATPGHTAGSVSLALNTDDGIWVSSSNGIAADAYAPRVSRIPGLRRYAEDWGQEVVLNGNTPEFAARHYDAMLLERAVADPAGDAPVPRCFPTAELTASPLAPGLAPTHVHGAVTSGTVRGQLSSGRSAVA